jgi:hypothetical protein
MDPSELPMNHTPALLNNSSPLNQLPTQRSALDPTKDGRHTDQVCTSEGRRFEEPGDGSQEVEMPVLSHSGLSERDDSP